jgi:hypothetical protein
MFVAAGQTLGGKPSRPRGTRYCHLQGYALLWLAVNRFGPCSSSAYRAGQPTGVAPSSSVTEHWALEIVGESTTGFSRYGLEVSSCGKFTQATVDRGLAGSN